MKAFQVEKTPVDQRNQPLRPGLNQPGKYFHV
jgi:hypothetical protein